MKKFGTFGIGLVLGLMLASGPTFARTTGFGCESLDINKDRRITAGDALLVLRASVGLDECE